MFALDGFGDAHGIAGLVDVEGRLVVHDHGLRGVHVQGVLTALQQGVLGVDVFHLALGALAGDILHHHHVAGLAHGEIGLGGHHQAEGLQRVDGLELTLAVLEDDLPEVGGPAFGGDAPQHIGQVLAAEGGGRGHVLELGGDAGASGFALDLGHACRPGQQDGALEVDLGGGLQLAIVDGLGRVLDHGHPVQGHRARGVGSVGSDVGGGDLGLHDQGGHGERNGLPEFHVATSWLVDGSRQFRISAGCRHDAGPCGDDGVRAGAASSG